MVISLSSRKPLFWILLSIVSISGAIFAKKFFSQAFPIVNLSITMDRKEALQAGQSLAKTYNWGPADYQAAASFDVEHETQYFVELEGGGMQQFNQLLHDPYYSPYAWTVRHFKEFEVNQTLIYFTPDGKPYGFEEKISEDVPGAALSKEQAHSIAMQAAQQWHIPLHDYTLVEHGQEKKKSNRLDHTFIYELTHKKIGVAPYRLTLVVSGDKLTQLKRSIQVPEAFLRRYAQMRSSNTTLSFIADLLMFLLYIVGGCGLGLWYLINKKLYNLTYPILWATIIIGLQILNSLNSYPLLWMHYDTALSLTSVISAFLLRIITAYGMLWIALIIIFATAEGLTRKAFGNQLQLWKLWAPKNLSSYQVIGRTIGGYLIIGFDFAFSIGFYYLALKYWGWWSPAETLYNPNVLATYVPAILPIAQSLLAGFMEECLFRAIPLAGAALLGARYGKRGLFVGIAFIAQAFIFGAAHANYAAQPAFARVIELIIPSFVFAGIYLRFGLLPSILSHYLFDCILFAIPIFAASNTDFLLNKVIVIASCFLPLLGIIYGLVRSRKMTSVSAHDYNKEWRRSAPPSKTYEPFVHQPLSLRPLLQKRWLGIVAGILGILGIAYYLPRHAFMGQLPARAQAETVVQQHIPPALKNWQTLLNPGTTLSPEHIFVWRTNRKAYEELLGSFIQPDAWKSRTLNFDQPVEERVHEFQTLIAQKNHEPYLYQFEEQLPENTPLETLDKKAAYQKALAYCLTQWHYTPHRLEKISALNVKKPHRIDWTFIFKLKEAVLQEGDQYITITISGDQITQAKRSINVPEAWQRSYSHEQIIHNIIIFIALIILVLFISLCVGILYRTKYLSWVYSPFLWRLFFILVLLNTLILFINNWETVLFAFETAKPFTHQLFITVCIQCLKMIFQSALLASITAYLIPLYKQRKEITLPVSTTWGLNLLAIGLSTLVAYLRPSLSPLIADSMPAASAWSFITIVGQALAAFYYHILILMAITLFFDRIAKKSYSWLWIVGSALLIQGCLAALNYTTFSYLLLSTIIGSIIVVGSYFLLWRYNLDTIIVKSCLFTTVLLLQQFFFNAFDHARIGYSVAIIIIIILTLLLLLHRSLRIKTT